MDAMPGDDVLAVFGVRAVAPLGGRLNGHWLVERRHTQLVLRRWYQPPASVAYEVQLMARLAALGWPVALVVDGPAEIDGTAWSLSPLLVGDPPSTVDALAEQRARGRLLAAFHHDLAAITDLGQRDPWRRCEDILSDPSLDAALVLREATRAED